MRMYVVQEDLFQKEAVSTEYNAYKCLKSKPLASDVNYLAIPWVTLLIEDNLERLRELPCLSGGFTVCQHVDYKKIIPILKQAGIDTLFTPHAEEKNKEINVKPFPHYAVNGVVPSIKKDIFYSFIGLDSTKMIGSNLRSEIFRMKHPQDTFVREREHWHWAREHGWGNLLPDEQKEQEEEYKVILSKSKFSLCPRGYGVSTIRFWESLQAGAIPVLLSDSLLLPEDPRWSSAIIQIPEKSVGSIPKVLEKIHFEQEMQMRQQCLEIYKDFSGSNFTSTIQKCYENKKN